MEAATCGFFLFYRSHMLDSKTILLLGAVLGGLAVALGAFGAHALKSQLSEAMLGVYETGIKYHAWHATVLLFLGLVSVLSQDANWRLAATLIAAGTLLFSGSLYALALGGPRWLGPVTPLGGLLLIAGWITIAIAAWSFRFTE